MSTSAREWFRWAWATPVAALLVTIAIVGTPLVRMCRMQAFLSDARKNHWATYINQPAPSATQPTKTHWQEFTEALPGRTEVAVLLNFPGLLINTVVSHFTPWSSWLGPLNYPLDRWIWRALVCPVYALPFWWIVGRSLDCATSMRKESLLHLRRWDIALMLPLAMICSAVTVGFSVSAIAADSADHDFVFMIISMGLWGLLSIFVCVTWLLQWTKIRSA